MSELYGEDGHTYTWDDVVSDERREEGRRLGFSQEEREAIEFSELYDIAGAAVGPIPTMKYLLKTAEQGIDPDTQEPFTTEGINSMKTRYGFDPRNMEEMMRLASLIQTLEEDE